jgi:zinc-ribbon domain
MPNFTILEPMSTGDVIDRAVRLYRRNFTPLVAIVSVPTLIGYVASLMFWYGYQHIILGTGASGAPDDAMWMLILGGLGYPVWLFALLLTVSGLARVIGDHVMMGDAITFRKCFSSVRRRFSDITVMGLLTMVILFGLYIILTIILLMLALVVGVVVGFVMAIKMPQWAVASITVVTVLVAIAAGLFIVSTFIARVVFLPQVVMIEGQSAGSAIGRAISLGQRNSFKVGAILLFTYFVSLSLMSALTLPVLAGLFLAGLLSSEFFSSTLWTVFYTSFKDVSSLLSLPIWIVSFTLLYFDSRVRKEAYDLELLARDIAPGYYWQPVTQAGAFGYQMPFAGGQGRAFVQTSPLGLAGYQTSPPPVVNAPPQPTDRPGEEMVEQEGENSPLLESAQNGSSSCQECGVALDEGAPFCSNCGSPVVVLKS